MQSASVAMLEERGYQPGTENRHAGQWFLPGSECAAGQLGSVSFSKEGFKTENHTSILVQGGRTATVNRKLEVGALATTVES